MTPASGPQTPKPRERLGLAMGGRPVRCPSNTMTPAAGRNHFDPLWDIVAPAAGLWCPQQAVQLAQLAGPPLR